jgi:single-strand DNA-binding protein
MRLAFNTRGKNSTTGEWEDQPNFIDVTLFGNRADALSRYLSKGSQIGVDGRLRWREWETPAGEKRSAIEVIVDEIEFVGGRSDGQGSRDAEPAQPSGSGDDLEGEEIPF